MFRDTGCSQVATLPCLRSTQDLVTTPRVDGRATSWFPQGQSPLCQDERTGIRYILLNPLLLCLEVSSSKKKITVLKMQRSFLVTGFHWSKRISSLSRRDRPLSGLENNLVISRLGLLLCVSPAAAQGPPAAVSHLKARVGRNDFPSSLHGARWWGSVSRGPSGGGRPRFFAMGAARVKSTGGLATKVKATVMRNLTPEGAPHPFGSILFIKVQSLDAALTQGAEIPQGMTRRLGVEDCH